MRRELQFLRRVYGLCLHLFPKQYREEYGAELQAVFGLSLEEAATRVGFEVEKLILREAMSLPKAVMLEHLRERKSTTMRRTFDSYFEFSHGSWKEFLTVLLPFFLAGAAMPLLTYFISIGLISASNALGTVILLTLFGLFLFLLMIGVKMGIPRWSLPYLGFLFSILSVYLFSAIFGTPIYFLFRDVRESSLFMDILWDGIFWYGLLTATIWLVVLTRISSTFHRFKNDWTQLSFTVYGAVPFAVWLSFDEYAGDEPYMLLGFLVLAVGAWFYLRSRGEWTRFGSLFVALTLTIFIAAAGKAILIPSQDWPFTIDQSTVMAEVKHTLIMWGWFALIMLVSLGGRMLPVEVSTDASPLEG